MKKTFDFILKSETGEILEVERLTLTVPKPFSEKDEEYIRMLLLKNKENFIKKHIEIIKQT